MLVLARKPGETLVINDNITITVVEIKGDNVRLAIDAPREVTIYRGEIHAAIVEANRAAALGQALPDLAALPPIQKPEKE